jgi:ADP-ribose pyrophosphatase YjhB (NUDIX family)
VSEAWYVEHDGLVLVVDHGDAITLPKDVDVPVDTYAERTLRGTTVTFGQAEVDEHPHEWPRKDDLIHHPDSSRLLRHAISASLFRPVCGVVVRQGDEILLVKPKRGVATGIWTLPGGFLHAFEQPQDGARREVREETGLEIEDLSLEATVTYSHDDQPYPIVGLGFTATPVDDEITLQADEIAEAKWVPAEEAIEDSYGLATRVLRRLIEGGSP